jgi:hypothetical protein
MANSTRSFEPSSTASTRILHSGNDFFSPSDPAPDFCETMSFRISLTTESASTSSLELQDCKVTWAIRVREASDLHHRQPMKLVTHLLAVKDLWQGVALEELL